MRRVVTFGNGPVQYAFFPDIEEAGHHEADEQQHFNEGEHLELLVNHSPWIEENRFDVEQDEKHRHQVELHTEAPAGVAERVDAALVRSVFNFVRNLASDYERQGHQRCRDDRRNCRLYEYREPLFCRGSRHRM